MIQSLDGLAASDAGAAFAHLVLALLLIGLLVSLAALLSLRSTIRFGPAFQANSIRFVSVALLMLPLLCVLSIQPPRPIAHLPILDRRATADLAPAVTIETDVEVTREVASTVHEFGRKSEISTASDRVLASQERSTPTNIQAPLTNRIVFASGALWILGIGVLTVVRLLVHVRTDLWCRRQSSHLPDLIYDACDDTGLNRAQVLCSSELKSPITMGLFRPVVVVPTGAVDWAPDQIRYALQHESAHVRRRDVWWCELIAWVRNFYWPLVPVRSLARMHGRLIELACDDIVLENAPDRYSYVDLLVRLARESRPAIGAWLPMASASLIQQRVDRALDIQQPGVSRPRRFASSMLMLGTVSLTVLLVATRPSFSRASTTLRINTGDRSATMSPSAKPPTARSGRSLFVVSASNWDATRRSIVQASDVVIFLDDTDVSTLPRLVSNDAETNRPRIFAVGLNQTRVEQLRGGQIDGIVTMQPYGMGYRGVELLVKSRFGEGNPPRLRIPPRIIRRRDAPSLARMFRLIADGEGPELSMDWAEPYRMMLKRSGDAAPKLSGIEVKIPGNSQWWDLVQAGSQRAAKQGGVDVTFSRIQVLSSGELSETNGPPVIYLRRQGNRATFTTQKPNDWGTAREGRNDRKFELALITDVSWLSKQLVQLIQDTGVKPMRIWLWHPDERVDFATQLSKSVESHFSYVAN